MLDMLAQFLVESRLFLYIGCATIASVISLLVCRYFVNVKVIQNTSRLPTEINLIKTLEEWEEIFPIILQHASDVKVLGLDCEWLPNLENEEENKVALLQLATYEGLCILVRLNLLLNIPASLCMLLADKNIIKVGVAVVEDGEKLKRHYNISVHGCVDLRNILSRVDGYYTLKTRGLFGLSEGILGYQMLKDPKIRCGNWEAPELSNDQIQYAAMDALVGLDIYIKLVMTKRVGHIPTIEELHIQWSHKDFQATSMILQNGVVDLAYQFRGNIQVKSLGSPGCITENTGTRMTNNKTDEYDSVRENTCFMCPRVETKSTRFVELGYNGGTIKLCPVCNNDCDKMDNW